MNSSLVGIVCRRASTSILLFNRAVNHRTAAAPVTPESLINEQQPQSNESKEHEKIKQERLASDKKARTSDSFVLNLFRGQFYPNEVFPYPNVLNEEQRDNVKMLIDPIWKFFEEKNDAAKNDQLEKVIKYSLSLQ
jgi:very long chain acyl-CoA dehydrogenase